MSNELRPKPPDAAGKKHGGDTVSAARSTDWGTYLAFGPVASAEFMDEARICRFRNATSFDCDQLGFVGFEVELDGDGALAWSGGEG